jgi:17beta-estradiol 17-dehydrogenase / very-long-chain 3-oxoacyl-CoA reductase
LAQKGFSIVLVSRTESKLSTLAKELEDKYASKSVKTKILAMDFSKNNDKDYEKFAATISGLDVSVLINNVGKSHDIPVPFNLTEEQEIKDIINVNCFGTLRVTQLVIPGMIERRGGLILTMGSFGGLLPTPLLATYSGSKAFLQHWSTALGSELKPYGIDVELALSYLVTSAMSKIRRPSATIPTPKAFVRATLSKIGRSGGAQGIAFTSTPFWSHGIMHWWIANVAGTSSDFVVEQNKGFHESIRSRALRKRERESKKA